ncbi:MAG: EAL domain-containing protein [Desulfocucumaceae bacterium]
MENIWHQRIETVDFALQPVVNIHTGDCFGVEFLLRNHQQAGFASIQDLFDQAYKDQCLYGVDMLLRAKAISKFAALPFYRSVTMFYNIDNRIMLMPDFTPGNTSRILQGYGLPNHSLCYEISERHDIMSFLEAKSVFNLNKQQQYKIAIDDFGTGFSGLQQLYYSEPDFIKIDRFFIADLDKDVRKRKFVSTIMDLAHVMGIGAIGEGVETEREFHACKEIGCDFVQGYFIQSPTCNIGEIKANYPEVFEQSRRNRRSSKNDQALISSQINKIEPICLPGHDLRYLFDLFRRHQYATFFPVVNQTYEPMGIVREKDLKEFVYSPYGKDLLMNRSSGRSLADFISKIPVADINSRLEKVVEKFSLSGSSEGIVITDNGRYAGYLSAGALLNMVHEKNLTIARDQNPLTKLPGNSAINDYIAESILDLSREVVFIYFDLDNFKPFNDRFGFRVGDRAINLFADILRTHAAKGNWFLGHIGGDDFFVGGKYVLESREGLVEEVKLLLAEFSAEAELFYEQAERKAGVYLSHARDGKEEWFPLLGASAAIIFRISTLSITSDHIGQLIAGLKLQAKSDSEKIAVFSL